VFKSLDLGPIGIRNYPLPRALELARATGFEGLDFNIREAADLAEANGVGYVRDLFGNLGLGVGAWGLPVNWQGASYESDLRELPSLAAVGADLGATRASTWMLPFSDERDFAQNFTWHVDRFRPIAEVLRDHGISFGIEFIGPKTLRAGHRYEFISTMDGLLDLARAIGTGNVGLLLDAFHLYTSGGQVGDLDRITAADVVRVHVNDAIAGVPRDEQLDRVRDLPMAQGVIDLPGFLRTLDRLGYAGPVTVEPFSERINALAAQDPDAAAREVAASLDRAWAAAGLE
jgi:sugar phosphate isomerase/epimerase